MADRPAGRSFSALTRIDARIKVVDIGASPIDGTPPYAALLRAGHADVIGFEPNASELIRLNRMKGPHESYLPHVIGDGARHTLYSCHAPGMTSLLPPNPAVLNLFHGFPDWGRVVSTELVDTLRLDDIPDTAGAEMIKLDIQGAELMALSHGKTRLRDALLIHCEVEFLPLYIGQPLFSEVEAFLRGAGFVLHRFFPAVSRVVRPLLLNDDLYAGLSQLVWADAIFIKDLSRLEALSDAQLLKTARILHDCYQSVDVALYLLTEYDRRTQESLGKAYLAGLQGAAAAGDVK
ncbi:MAG TPA: FkbM family methyltransferase [Mycobacteriales bacterium]|nr:FkbM family methyltransferase [Mycobacteriales bacterium]